MLISKTCNSNSPLTRRLSGINVQIVPNVRGTVVEVPVKANEPIKQGDVLAAATKPAAPAI
jgi:multidrug resistance efflux pump